ncbi:MAG: aminotransferase class V-fold PLP-dependent enzyme [Caldilineales bacterium]|nr:aminotransferase class V-fold PLP-dependent enzyme [Caldilineales bacterium]
MPDSQHIASIRAALPAVNQYAYLNTGTCGPLPQPAIDALASAARDQAEQGRIQTELYFSKYLPDMHRLRVEFAKLFGAATDDVALTHNTTDGINIAVWGQDWRAGEEVVVTDLEHEGGVMPAILAARKFGLNLRTLSLLDCPPADVPNRIEDQLTPASRLLVISHVSWSNGALLPLDEIMQAAHARGCQVVIDAAQSAGAVPLDLPVSGVDYYAVPGQKWLCGPEGIGTLYVSPAAMERLSPTYTGYFAMNMEAPDCWSCYGHLELAPNARRFEASSIYLPGVYGMLASLQWLRKEVGWDWAFARIAHLHRYARGLLGRNSRLRLFTPDPAAGLLHFYLPADVSPEFINSELIRRDLRIRTIPHMACLRVSTGFWNTEEEIDELAAALEELLEQPA